VTDSARQLAEGGELFGADEFILLLDELAVCGPQLDRPLRDLILEIVVRLGNLLRHGVEGVRKVSDLVIPADPDTLAQIARGDPLGGAGQANDRIGNPPSEEPGEQSTEEDDRDGVGPDAAKKGVSGG
jgi:hypothetical protein